MFRTRWKDEGKKNCPFTSSLFISPCWLWLPERPYRHNKQALGTHLPPTTSRSGRNIGAPTSQPDIQRRPFPSTVYKRKRKAYRQDSLFCIFKTPQRDLEIHSCCYWHSMGSIENAGNMVPSTDCSAQQVYRHTKERNMLLR